MSVDTLEEKVSSVSSIATANPKLKDETSSSQEKCDLHHENIEEIITSLSEVERPTRLNLASNSKVRSHSSSPMPTQKRSRNISSHSTRRLHKTRSLKSLEDLEIEEVKGFMDLGFLFKKENITYRMMSLIPGLQRLGACKNEVKEHSNRTGFDQHLDEGDRQGEEHYYCYHNEDNNNSNNRTSGVVMRPYLSEAWLIKKPDSPLLNLRIPRVTTNADMKRHLRYWARTVASEIQQVS